MASTNLSERGLIAVTWIGTGLGILFTSCRLAIRLTRLKRLLADDYSILAALFFLISNAILQTLQAPHLYYIVQTPQGSDIAHHSVMYVHYEFVIIALFWTILWSVKAAFLAIFWKTTDQLPFYRRWWWAIVVFCILAYVGCWLASALNCHPPSAYFKFGQCNKPIDQRGSLISISYSTAVDILSDLMIMTLALWIVWSTTISLRQKLGLVVVFSLGGIIIAFAIVRAINILGRSYTDAVGLAIWGIAESSISVIVGCLPPFKTFLSRHNSTYASRYPPVYAQRTTSQKRPVFKNASSDEVPLDPEYEMTRSRIRVSSGNARSDGADEGEIRVTQGFVSVAMPQG
ncbi:hypothetical protein BDW72DRAFT_210324 [Aspergillus terricola var. indicus]